MKVVAMQSREFYLRKRFYDDRHFPYGFSRSGDFTVSEVAELEKFGNLFKALVDGQVSDPTEEDQHFLQVMQGETPASTLAEKAWLKYLKCCNRSPVWLTTRRAANDAEDDFVDDEDTIDDDYDEALEA
jgi:hypothetical protein